MRFTIFILWSVLLLSPLTVSAKELASLKMDGS